MSANVKLKRSKAGQPTVMTEELQRKILEHVTSGGTIASYCRENKYPNQDTVFNFMALEAGQNFSEEMLRARERGTHAIAEQCIVISDEKDADAMRAKLRVDTRLKLIGMWNRKTYGQKQDIDVTARLSLGDLVDAAIKHAASSLPMIDVTPAVALPAPQVTIEQESQPAPAPATAVPVDQPARRATRRTAS